MSSPGGAGASTGRSLRRSITAGSCAGLVLPLVGILKSVVLIPILLANLGEHAYGVYVLAATGTGYALTLAGFGLDSSMYRFAPARLSVDGGRSTFFACLTVAAFSGGLVAMAGLLAFGFYPLAHDYRSLPLIVGGICFFQTAWTVCFSFQRARDRMLWVVAAVLAFNLLEFIVYVTTAIIWRDVVGMFLAILCLNVVWAGIWLARQLRTFGVTTPTRTEVRAIATFGGHTVVNTLILGAFLTIDKFLLGIAAAPAVLAFYAPASGIAQILGSLASLSLLSVPHLLARAHDDSRKDDICFILRFGLRIYYFLAIPALFGLLVTAEPFLTLLIGSHLAEKGASIAMIFLVALFLLGLQRFPAQYLRVRGLSGWINFVSAMALAVYVVALFAAYVLGLNLPYAIPVIYLCVMLVQTTVVWGRAQHLDGFRLYAGDLIPPVVFAGVCIGPGLLFDLSHWSSLVPYIFAAAFCYCACAAIWWRFEPVKPGIRAA